MIKSPVRLQDQSLIHEAFVGIYALNQLRKRVSNFTYTLGMTTCSPLFVRSLDRRAVSVCDASGTVQYLLLENLARKAEDGTDLSRSLRSALKNDLTSTEYLGIFSQLLYALNYAYNEVGFIHHDLHPGNILLLAKDKKKSNIWIKTVDVDNADAYIQSRELAVILDFGLSRIELNAIEGNTSILKAYSPNLPGAGIRRDRSVKLFDLYKIIISNGSIVSSGLARDPDNYRLQSLYQTLDKMYRFFAPRQSLTSALRELRSDGMGSDLFYASYHPLQKSLGDLAHYLNRNFPIISSALMTRDAARVQKSTYPIFSLPPHGPVKAKDPMPNSALRKILESRTYSDFVYGSNVWVSRETPNLFTGDAEAESLLRPPHILKQIPPSDIPEYVNHGLNILKEFDISTEMLRLRTKEMDATRSWPNLQERVNQQIQAIQETFREVKQVPGISGRRPLGTFRGAKSVSDPGYFSLGEKGTPLQRASSLGKISFTDLTTWVQTLKAEPIIITQCAEFISDLISSYTNSTALRIYGSYLREFKDYLGLAWTPVQESKLQVIENSLKELDADRIDIETNLLKVLYDAVDTWNKEHPLMLKRFNQIKTEIYNMINVAEEAGINPNESRSNREIAAASASSIHYEYVIGLLNKYTPDVYLFPERTQAELILAGDFLKTTRKAYPNLQQLIFGALIMFLVPLTLE